MQHLERPLKISNKIFKNNVPPCPLCSLGVHFVVASRPPQHDAVEVPFREPRSPSVYAGYPLTMRPPPTLPTLMVTCLLAKVSVLRGFQPRRLSRAAALTTSAMTAEPLHGPDLMDHMLFRIQAVNQIPYNLGLIDFTVSGRPVGKVTPKVAERLASSGAAFELSTGE